MATRPYLLYPPGWPERARARAFASFEAAVRAGRRLANETGQEVRIALVPRFGGGSGREIERIRPVHERDRDLRDDVGLAHGIGMEF